MEYFKEEISMSSFLRPRRGKKSTAISQLTASNPLKRGEVFFEVPDDGVGTGVGAIKMGDGTSAYSNLPYFIDGTSIVSESKTASDSGTDLSLVTTGEKYDWNNPSLSLASDSGTSQISLSADTKYKLTVGSSTLVFTTPEGGGTGTTYNAGQCPDNTDLATNGSVSRAYTKLNNDLATVGEKITPLKTTTFPSDGSILDTYSANESVRTVFNSDGSISEIHTKDGTVTEHKTIFNSNGSISVVDVPQE